MEQKSEDSDIRISPEVSDSSPFAGIKTLFNIKHDDIMQSLRESIQGVRSLQSKLTLQDLQDCDTAPNRGLLQIV